MCVVAEDSNCQKDVEEAADFVLATTQNLDSREVYRFECRRLSLLTEELI